MKTTTLVSRILRPALVAIIALSCLYAATAFRPDDAFASDGKLSAGASAELVKKGTLTVLMSPDYPPFENVVNGKYVGYDIDVAKALAKRLGLKVKFKVFQFDRILGAIVAGGQGDIAISGFSADPERSRGAIASRSYFEEKTCLVVAKGSKFKSAKSLNSGKAKIAVARSYLGEYYATEALPKSRKIVLKSEADCLRAVKKGTADACAVSHYTLSGKKGFKKLKTVKGDKYVIYMSQSDKKLKADIDRALAKMEKDGTLKKLRKKYW